MGVAAPALLVLEVKGRSANWNLGLRVKGPRYIVFTQML